MAQTLFRCLEIIHGPDLLHDIYGRTNLGDNLLDTLVGHRRLIQGIPADAGGIDTGHLLTVFPQGQLCESFLPAHQPAGTMRCGVIPVRITFANADQAAVTHVDGDQQLFTRPGGHGAFAQDHVVGVDIVVNGSELLHSCQTHSGQDHVHHGFAVQCSKMLDDTHIVDIVVEQLTGHPGQILGNINRVFFAQTLNGGLDLLIAAFLFQLCNGLLDLVISAAPEGLAAFVLIERATSLPRWREPE